MSETCVLPLHFGAGGLHGRKGSLPKKARKADSKGLYLRPVLFYANAGTGYRESNLFNPETMLRPNTHQNRYNATLYIIDLRSVREGCVPSSAAYETPQQKLYKRQADKDWYRLPPLHIAVQRSSATGGGMSFVASNNTRRSGKHPPDR